MPTYNKLFMAFPYWSLSGFYFCYFAFVGALTPYWGLYLQSLDFSAFQIGVLMSLLQVMRIFAPNLWGWLADHTGRRAAIVQVAAVASLAAYLGVFFGTGFAWLFTVMSLMSFFWSASLPLVEATTLSRLGSHTARYGYVRLWGSIGFILAVVGVGYALDRLPVARLPLIVLGFMLGIIAFSRRIPESEVTPGEADDASVWTILRRPEVAALIGACFLMAAAHGPYYTFFSIYLVEHGYSKGAVGWLWALGVICEIVVFLYLPRLFHVYPLKAILVFSFAAAVARFLLIAWAVESFVLMLIAQVLHAFTFGSFHAAAVAFVHRLFPGRHQAKGQAFYTSLSFGAGGTLGGLYAGYTWDALGPGATYTIASAFAFLAMVLVMRKVRE